MYSNDTIIVPQNDVSVDMEHIALVIETFPWLKNVVEIRSPKTERGTCSGYFNDPAKIAEEIEKIKDIAKGIYFTPHEIKPAFTDKITNKIIGNVRKSTEDEDISTYRLLLIDLDPVRASNTSSTEEEHDAALELADKVKQFLSGMGFPEPVSADSGNGAHLNYFIELPNTKENIALIKQVLTALSALFSNDKVKVDEGVFNPARIWKLYGTMARKGDNTTERPHRMARMISIPEQSEVVSGELLEKIAALMPQPEKKFSGKNKSDGIDLPAWLEEHGIEVAYTKDIENGKLYSLEQCAWNNEHKNSAFVIEFDDGGHHAHCFHDSCKGKGWLEFVKAFEPEWNPPKKGKSKEEKISDSKLLLDLIPDLEMIKSDLGDVYARVLVDDHYETLYTGSDRFKQWLVKIFSEEYHKTIGSESVNQVVLLKTSQAEFGKNRDKVYLRTALRGKEFWYDLADDNWRAVRITPDGWEIVNDHKIYFRRHKNTGAQVEPIRCDNGLFKLLDFVNLVNDEDKALLLIYVVSCFVPEIPRVIALFRGQKGASKSMSMRLIRRVVDPAYEELLGIPKDEDSFNLILSNNYMPVLDNLDRINGYTSDILCRASTGGGRSKRKLYSDNEDIITKTQHCIMMNGINLTPDRDDLVDRTITFELKRIDEKDRMTERTLNDRFEKVRPYILAGVFDALSKAMKIHQNLELTSRLRMGDFTEWGYAIAEAIGIGGEKFLSYYRRNCTFGNEGLMNSNPFAYAISILMSQKNECYGTAAELLEELESIAIENKIDTKHYEWPKGSSALSAKLNQIQSNLLDSGIEVIKGKGTSKRGTRNCAIITLRMRAEHRTTIDNIEPQNDIPEQIISEKIIKNDNDSNADNIVKPSNANYSNVDFADIP